MKGSLLHLNLGFFENFKGGDAVVLSAPATDLAALSDLLFKFVQSGDSELALHQYASGANNLDVKLFAVSDDRIRSAGYAWLCNPCTLPEIMTRLGTLVCSGHQYFDLVYTDVQLIVSTGEYSLEWWQQVGTTDHGL